MPLPSRSARSAPSAAAPVPVPAPVSAGTPGGAEAHRRGGPGFRRATGALFAAGLATFMTLYCVQALLPSIADHYGLSPASASLTVSVATAAMAVAVIPLTALSDAFGRVPMMSAALFAAGVCGVLSAFAPSFTLLLVLRALQGVALAGLQATAMSYLAEEVHRESLGAAMGLYVAGNGIGGMAGRLLAGGVLDVSHDWRWGIGVVGAASLLCAVAFKALIPPSARFRPRPLNPRALAAGIGRALPDSGMLRLYLIGFVLMGGFVTVYNYLGFRLLAAPFHLSQAFVGLIFVTYLAGSAASALAGRLVDRLGRRSVLVPGVVLALAGLAVMLSGSVAAVVAGLVVFTAGFFAAHAVASGWVGARSRALGAQGSAVYLFCYYLGSAVGGSVGGLAYSGGGWNGVSLYTGALVCTALVTAASLWRLRPLRAA